MPPTLPPGPAFRPPLGIVGDFQQDPLGLVMRLRATYGGVVNVPGPPGTRTWMVTDPAQVHDLLVRQPDALEKPALLKHVLRGAFGNGLFFSEGAFWRRQRRLMQPAFHHQYIQTYATRMLTKAEQVIARWQTRTTCHLDEEMHALTLAVIVDALFGGATTETEAAHIGTHMRQIGAAVNEQGTNPLKAMLPDWAPLPLTINKRRAQAALDAHIYGLIRARRAASVPTDDLLSTLLAAVDEDDAQVRMSDQQLRDEAMTLFIAGHETTAHTLTWAFIELARHPEHEARLHAELARVLAGRLPTVADLPNLPYTEWIIKEILRLYPAAWILFRQVMRPLDLGPYHATPGTLIWIVPYVTHRDPLHFPAPERFWPERFAPDAAGHTLEQRLPKLAYHPFGGGPRVCLGNGFALLEARLMLAALAQRFHLALAPGYIPKAIGAPTLNASAPVRMTLSAR